MSDNGAQPEAAKESEVPTITVTFTPDGQMGLSVYGGVGPPQMWAAAHLIELWGDSQFADQQLTAAQIAKRIAVPSSADRGIRKLRP